MAPDPSAPAVVLVVVSCDPGDWFDEVLRSLAAQDYPNLSVLVVDAGSREDPTARVARTLPGAFVRRLERRVPFGRATNDVLEVVAGASHLLLCHDDAALEPDAVSVMVEEAFRSNAGAVTPKIVEWAAPERLVAVGAGADRYGVVHPLVEPGELDQVQHDGVRDVFVAPGAAMLVRADLFAALGGYDEAVADCGEDLDLSWRVHLAGARIVTAPAARVRHLGASEAGLRPGSDGPAPRRRRHLATESHRWHTVLTCYGVLRLVVMAPLAVVHSAVEAVGLVASGRSDDAAIVLRALAGVLGHPARLRRARHRTQHLRRARDADVADLQTGGSARLRGWARARAVGDRAANPVEAPLVDDQPATEGRAGLLGAGNWRVSLAGAVFVVVLWLVGTWSLFGATLPAVGGLPSTSAGVGAWWHSWWSTWRPSGLGRTGPGAPGLGLLALLGTVLGGSAGLAEHVVVFVPLLVGPFGAQRMVRAWGSPRSRVVAAVAYAVVPLPYDALARGDWGALVAYAGAPWVVSGVGRLAGTVPHPAVTLRSVAARVVGLGLAVAVVAAVAPAWLVVVVAVGVGALLGSLLAGSPWTGVRSLAVAAGAAVIGAVLLLPWSASVLGHRVATFGVAPGPAQRLGLGQLLLFHTGPIGHGVLGWGLLVAAALPLAIGQGWRLEWASRLWGVAVACVALAWIGSRGWVPAPVPDLCLAPAGAAIAGAVALGVVAFEMDLPGYRFGWRQLASGVAALAVAVGAVPVLQAAGNGRWYLPSADASSVVPLATGGPSGDYRVLWVGDPSAIPLPSQQLRPGVGWATSWDGMPDATDEWAGAPAGGSAAVVTALHLASGQLTTRLGHLLAPLAVRFVVVPDHLAPVGSGAPAVPTPTAVLRGLAQQVDLQQLPGGQGYTVYQNSAWLPARAVLPAGTGIVGGGTGGDGAGLLRALESFDPGRAVPALGGGPDGGRGSVTTPGVLYVATGPDGSWRVQVGGRRVAGTRALGTGEAYVLDAAGAPGGGGVVGATVSAPSSAGEHVAAAVEVALWALVTAGLLVDRRRRVAAGPEPVDPAWWAHEVRRRQRRSPRPVPAGLDADGLLDDEEVWSGG